MIPTDNIMLMSFLNTKLRDEYPSFAALCEDLELDGGEIEAKLSAIGYVYDGKLNRFLRSDS